MSARGGPVWRAPLLVWGALVALLALSVLAAFAPLGDAKTTVSLAIAGVKAVLIGLVFMRLDKASNLVRLAALAGLVFAAFLFLLTAGDYLTRS